MADLRRSPSRVRVRAVQPLRAGAAERGVSGPQAKLIRLLLAERAVPPELAWRPPPATEADAAVVIDQLKELPRLGGRGAQLAQLRAEIVALLDGKPTRAQALALLAKAADQLVAPPRRRAG